MKEYHSAYKILHAASALVSSQIEIADEHMLNLLQTIAKDKTDGIYWVFKQMDGHPKEPLCIVDVPHGRIYYHHSGLVDSLAQTIAKLSQRPN